jgi:hypothetical protein
MRTSDLAVATAINLARIRPSRLLARTNLTLVKDSFTYRVNDSLRCSSIYKIS